MDQRSEINADATLKLKSFVKTFDDKIFEVPDLVELEKMKEEELLELLVKLRRLHSDMFEEILKRTRSRKKTKRKERVEFEQIVVPILHEENLTNLAFPVLHPLHKQTPQFAHAYDPQSCPINIDIRDLNWEMFGRVYQADVVLLDPPWNLSTEAPTRGVAIQYDMLTNLDIMEIVTDILTHVQKKKGAVFIWTINSRFDSCMSIMMSLGYRLSDNISWVKTSRLHNMKRFAKGHGFYCQHAKENLLFFVKGDVKIGCRRQQIFFGQRSGQSQKPTEIYHYIERLVPKGNYLEVFGRKNNLRPGWVTVGNELV